MVPLCWFSKLDPTPDPFLCHYATRLFRVGNTAGRRCTCTPALIRTHRGQHHQQRHDVVSYYSSRWWGADCCTPTSGYETSTDYIIDSCSGRGKTQLSSSSITTRDLLYCICHSVGLTAWMLIIYDVEFPTHLYQYSACLHGALTVRMWGLHMGVVLVKRLGGRNMRAPVPLPYEQCILDSI